jgi:hypothetical protein
MLAPGLSIAAWQYRSDVRVGVVVFTDGRRCCTTVYITRRRLCASVECAVDVRRSTGASPSLVLAMVRSDAGLC